MTLNKQKLPLIFRCKISCLYNRQDLQDAILWKAGGKPVQLVKAIFMHGRYPAISIRGQKYHIHRLIMEHVADEPICSCECVHHKNECLFDARICNLEIMKKSKHASLHNKGKVLTESHKAKISAAGKKRRGFIVARRRTDIPEIEMNRLYSMCNWSINRLAEYYKCDWSTIKLRIHDNPELEQK